MSVGLFIPAYNAERTLARVIERIPRPFSSRVSRIWVIDDGSEDATAEVARELAREQPRLELISLARNQGYGGAVKRGLAAAKAAGVQTAICLHADGQYAPEELPRLLDELATRRLDLLQGSRIAAGTALSGGMPAYKFVANRVLTGMENRVFALRMSDYHSGLLLYGAKALGAIPFERLSGSFDFDLEVIATARALGLSVGESPIPTHYGDEISYLDPITYGLRVLRVMGRYLTGHYHRL